MVDMFAHATSRSKFMDATEHLATETEHGRMEQSTRELLGREPVAILYCINGSFVKASPTVLKTSNGLDDAPHSKSAVDLLQRSYKDYLEANKSDGVKEKNYTVIEVTSSVEPR